MTKTITRLSIDTLDAAIARTAKATKLTPDLVYIDTTPSSAQSVCGIPFQSAGSSSNANVALSDLGRVLSKAIEAGKTVETWGDGTFYIEG